MAKTNTDSTRKQDYQGIAKIFYDMDENERENGVQDGVTLMRYPERPSVIFGVFTGDKIREGHLTDLRIGNYTLDEFTQLAGSYGLVMDMKTNRHFTPGKEVRIPFKQKVGGQ